MLRGMNDPALPKTWTPIAHRAAGQPMGRTWHYADGWTHDEVSRRRMRGEILTAQRRTDGGAMVLLAMRRG